MGTKSRNFPLLYMRSKKQPRYIDNVISSPGPWEAVSRKERVVDVDIKFTSLDWRNQVYAIRLEQCHRLLMELAQNIGWCLRMRSLEQGQRLTLVNLLHSRRVDWDEVSHWFSDSDLSTSFKFPIFLHDVLVLLGRQLQSMRVKERHDELVGGWECRSRRQSVLTFGMKRGWCITESS